MIFGDLIEFYLTYNKARKHLHIFKNHRSAHYRVFRIINRNPLTHTELFIFSNRYSQEVYFLLVYVFEYFEKYTFVLVFISLIVKELADNIRSFRTKNW